MDLHQIWISTYTDGSVDPEKQTSGCGVTIYDRRGHVDSRPIREISKAAGMFASSTRAETIAMVEGLEEPTPSLILTKWNRDHQ